MSSLNKLLDFGFDKIDLWRSEEMQLVQLIIPAESAHDTVGALGDVGLLQFKDLNSQKSAFQRTYANQVKRCDEMARKLRFFKEQVEKAGLTLGVRPFSDNKGYDMDELEAKLEELETELLEMNANSDRLQRSASELTELNYVLEKAGLFFDSSRIEAQAENFDRTYVAEDMGAPLLESGQPVETKVGRLGFVSGLIQQEKLAGFERLLFRATRGNMFLKQTAVGKSKDPATGEMQEKSVFVVFFAGERARTKILKICEAFGANRYPFPEDTARQRQMASEVNARLRDLNHTIEAGNRHRETVLQNIAFNMEAWTNLVHKEKVIYHTLNKFSIDVTRKVLVAEAWVPVTARARVQEALRSSTERSSTQIGTVLQPLMCHEQPPTYFKTDKFSECFQMIVEAYGIGRYREVNPAVYTIMTFPFLFAVMFGDFGHGLLMLAFAGFLLYNEKTFLKQKLNEIFAMAFGGRYCIMLMSIFSIYVGLLYNEFFSMPMSLWGGTRFHCKDHLEHRITKGRLAFDLRGCEDHHNNGHISFDPRDGPYPIGVDPIWHGTKGELPFLNSMKMKMSIVLGVTHMNLGILMSLFNHLYFRDALSIWAEFVPQIIFLNSLFGYLTLLIIGKWWKPIADATPADLYHVMIYMFLGPGDASIEYKNAEGKLVQYTMYPGQSGMQVFLVLIALISVPWMLFPKPYILKARHEKASKDEGDYNTLIEDEERSQHGAAGAHSGGGGHGDHGEHFEFGEVMVHQMIHTIEFVLGAVSNTASYLRLWALSLAHSQLSAVFYDRVLMMTIDMGSPFFMMIGFFMFFAATLGVLMVMESLSAFLHALRLHWVEFQNKFYRGDGYKFTPFTFEKEEE